MQVSGELNSIFANGNLAQAIGQVQLVERVADLARDHFDDRLQVVRRGIDVGEKHTAHQVLGAKCHRHARRTPESIRQVGAQPFAGFIALRGISRHDGAVGRQGRGDIEPWFFVGFPGGDRGRRADDVRRVSQHATDARAGIGGRQHRPSTDFSKRVDRRLLVVERFALRFLGAAPARAERRRGEGDRAEHRKAHQIVDAEIE